MYLVYNTILIIGAFVSGQRPVESLDRDQCFECMCVYVLRDVSVITWPTALETETDRSHVLHGSLPRVQKRRCMFV